ncbi:hypothetical protein CJF30_00005023 [Rutstroemia sp. NJR-2017a BBW]|nr:hypothetical protein CJF30_00005023 [Rutstroemia sp. NJR-2017a BBW]
MAPTTITEDYYMILEVVQTATPGQIIKSYRRLALKLHPDRNAKHNATEAFQLLGRAYETLKDESKRRAYDLIYPSIPRNRPSPQTGETPRPPPGSTPQSRALSEEAEIAALEKSKHERSTQWKTKKNHLDSLIFGLMRDIQRLEQEIHHLNRIILADVKAEMEEAQRKNNWGTWLLSPIFKDLVDSEEEKARKDRVRQERRLEKDMKERRLGWKKADLKKEEALLQTAKEEVDAADLVDSRKIRMFEGRIRAREVLRAREKEERERAERERTAREWRQRQEQEQREKWAREAAEALRRKQEAEKRAAEQKRAGEAAEALRKKQEAEKRAAEQKRVREAVEALRKKQEAEKRAAEQKWEKRVREAAEAPRKNQAEEKRAAEQKRAREAAEVLRKKQEVEKRAAEQKRAGEAAEALRKKQEAKEQTAEQKWEKRVREAVEASRKKQAEERAAEQKRQEEQAKLQKIIDDEAKKHRLQCGCHMSPEYCFTSEGSSGQAFTSTCLHGGWWPKVQGRMACPKCSESWTYMLQCPGCKMKACPRCQKQTATPKEIADSYKRLALKLHPDRTLDYNTTAAFQELQNAYEILKDEIKRRDYDETYRSTERYSTDFQTAETSYPPHRTATHQPPPTSTPHQETLSYEAQIEELQRSKKARGQHWMTEQIKSSAGPMEREIERLSQELQALQRVMADEVAAEERIEAYYANKTPRLPLRSPGGHGILDERESRQRAREQKRQKAIALENQLISWRMKLEKERRRQSEMNSAILFADMQDDARIEELRKKIQERNAREKEEYDQKWQRAQWEQHMQREDW